MEKHEDLVYRLRGALPDGTGYNHCRPTGVRGGLPAKRHPGLPGTVLHVVCPHGGGAEGVGAHLVLAAAPPKMKAETGMEQPPTKGGRPSAFVVPTLRYAPGSPRRFGAPAYPHRAYRPAGDPIGSPRRCSAPALCTELPLPSEPHITANRRNYAD